MSAFLNSDGLLVRFGRDQGRRGAKAGVTTDTTKKNELVFYVKLTGAARTLYSTDRNNDGTNDGFGGLDTPIPTGAVILDQNVVVIETPAGGTNYSIGAYQLNGTAINAAGIRTTAGANGTLVGTQTTQDNYLTAVTTGTYTAGKLKVVVTYLIR